MRLLLGGLLAASLVMSANVQAADGLKVSATVSRTVPADVLVLTLRADDFDSPSREASRAMRDDIETALAKIGAKVSEWRIFYVAPPTASPVRPPLGITKTISITIGSFDNVDEVLKAVAGEGKRQLISLSLNTTKAEQIRAELDLEAKRQAKERADRQAQELGVPAGSLIDLSSAGVPGSFSITGVTNFWMSVDGQTRLLSHIPGDMTVTLMSTATATLKLDAAPR